jgi:hypothetical protein
MMIMWSLSLFLFNHPRRPVPTSPPWAVRSIARSRLTIAVDRVPDLPDSFVDAMLTEAAAIWQPLGVELRGSTIGTEAVSASAGVRVIVSEDRDDGVPTGDSLGWIRFHGPSDPEPIVHLSRASAMRLLDATSRLREEPNRFRELLLARIMGRALAHELGHYLLASTEHSAHGLMRAALPLDALIATERTGFGLA